MKLQSSVNVIIYNSKTRRHFDDNRTQFIVRIGKSEAAITRMHGSAIRCVRSMTRVYGKRKIRPPPVNTKWIKIFKRRPEYMITPRS